ncbi:hypothetical protein OIE69_21190 [Actinacidiphila glaucinigra]|uniref:hypothetical protein n=1 Tax=Actinacidiphila glaucinigra TaxID=235986 RepID=UPI002DDBB8B7|nr:hypothetical protein [Actinacidiphila glaucinigra]WSD61243.1 hypothetical protein OIE69_21190 [Actinacidiphila glaucinigra]
MTRSSSRFPRPARCAPAAGLLLPPLVCLVLVPLRTRLSDTHVALVLVVAVVAVADADHLARIHETARLARSAVSPHVVVDHVRDQLVSLLHLRGCRFEYGTLVGHPPRLEQDGTVMLGRRPWDADTLGPPDQEVELRVFHNGHFHGRFMMLPTPGAVPSRQARLVAITLAEQAGSAIAGTPTVPTP